MDKPQRQRRNAIFSPAQKLFSVVENVCGVKIKLLAGDIVAILDDTTDKTYWLVRKVDHIGRVHKKYLKPLDKTSIGVHYMNSKHQDHFSAQHQIESRLGPMPFYYQVMGAKVIEHTGKYVTVFFILVKALTANVNPLRKNETSPQESWIVAKSQRCFMRLAESLERYLGQGNVPCVPNVKIRKPTNWTTERWLKYRCEALQGFFDELRHPRRGLVTSSFGFLSPHESHYSQTGLLDTSHTTLRSNYQPSSYHSETKGNDVFTFEGVYGNRLDDEPVFESPFHSSSATSTSTTTSKIQNPTSISLIDALIPLNIFLRTDFVKIYIPSSDSKEEVILTQTNYDPNSTNISCTDPTISDWKIVINNKLIEPFPPTPQLIHDYMDFLGEPGLNRPKFFPPFPEFTLEDPKSYSDEEIFAAVRSGNFEISTYTPITSLLKFWVVASADCVKDHDESQSSASPSYGFESEVSPENQNLNEDSDDGNATKDEVEENWSISNTEYRVRCTRYPSRAARASITALGAEGRLNVALSKYLEKPRRRTITRPSVAGLLINDKQKSITASVEKYQHLIGCMSEYLKDAKDSRSGLNAFAQFSLSSLIVLIKQSTLDQPLPVSVNTKSMHDLAAVHPSAHASAMNLLANKSIANMKSNQNMKSMSNMKASQKKLVNSFYDTGSDSILGLNEKINTLSLAWERRRMEALQREQDILEGLVTTNSTSSNSNNSIENNDLKIKYSEYMSTLDQTTKPYPSQLNNLEPMTSSALTKWLALRAKSRLSRKSDRVVKIERMTKLDQTYQKLRITIEQFVAIMDVIDQDDEKQHALYTLISRITDCIELDHYNIWGPLTLSPDDEKKANLIISTLRSEAKAELFYKKINYLYELSLKHRKTGKLISTKIPKGFNTSTWKDITDPALIPPKSKIIEFKQDIQTLRKLITECRNYIDEGASYVTDGAIEQTNAANYTLELKKLVSKSEAVSKMKGVLSAGKPEYLVHMKLKTSLMATERARTLSAQAVDEIASSYTLLKRILSELEETLTLLTEYAQYIQRKHLQTSSNGSNDGEEVIGLFDDELLEGESPQHENVGPNAASGMASGWRREMHEIFADNFYKFKKSCGIDNDSDATTTATTATATANPNEGNSSSPFNNNGSNISSIEQNRIIDLTRMCIILSRIPLLRDTHSAMEEWNQRENEMNNEDEMDDLITEEVDEEGEDDDEDEEEGEGGQEEENEEEIMRKRMAMKGKRPGVTFQD